MLSRFSCVWLCDPMDCSLPDSSVQGILQARILERVSIPPPGDLPNPESNPHLLRLPHCRQSVFFFNHWATGEAIIRHKSGFIKIVILKIFKMPSNAALSLLYKEFICLKVNTSETMKTSLSDNWESHSVKAIAASDFPKSTKPPTGLIFTLHLFFFS